MVKELTIWNTLSINKVKWSTILIIQLKITFFAYMAIYMDLSEIKSFKSNIF